MIPATHEDSWRSNVSALNSALERLLTMADEGHEPSPDENSPAVSPVPPTIIEPTILDDMTLNNYENYFADAQESCQISSDQFSRWSRMPEFQWPCEPVLRPLLKQLENFFANTTSQNLLVTSIISKLCLLPHESLQLHVVYTNVVGPLESLLAEARARAQKIPGFRRRLDVVRRYCGDDLVSILCNISGSVSLEEEDLETMLRRATGESRLSRPSSASTNADHGPNKKLVAFAPTYVILHEFAKEMAAILFIVGRNMEMSQIKFFEGDA